MADRERPRPEEGPLTVLYEDDWLLIVDKPAGTVVHPTYKHPSGTLLNAVLWRCRDRPGVQPGILTRLDKDTSGLVVIAMTPAVHAALQRDGSAGMVIKEYFALVRGTPEPRAGRIALPLARDTGDRRRVVVADGGAPSETLYEVLASGRGVSAVCCRLVTGRTHQIRVHLAARGWPLLGDRVYGSADPRLPRQALHAWRVRLPHPASGRLVLVQAAVPLDMQILRPGW